jgi:hypothetical protein
MTPKALQSGYEWCYRKMFSLRSILRRCPRNVGEILPYLAMSLLYKRSNFLWPLLIQHRLTHLIWHPFLERSRKRHLRSRKRLEQGHPVSGVITPISPGV